MDVLEVIKKRRSIRSFKEQDIKKEDIEMLIEAARWAPSAGNTQPWEFVIVRRPDLKKELAEAALAQGFVEEAPIVIVVCANENRSFQSYGIRGKTLYCIQETAAAIQNIHLVAHSLGLGTCWIGAFNEEETAKILKVPNDVRPVAIVPIGYPAESPTPRSRRPLNQIIHYETF